MYTCTVCFQRFISKVQMKLSKLRPNSTLRRDHKCKPANLEVWHHIIETPFPQIRESRSTTRVGRNSNSHQRLLPPLLLPPQRPPSFHCNLITFALSPRSHISSTPREQSQTSLRHQHQHPPSRILVPSE
jgi:hypothetical protein